MLVHVSRKEIVPTLPVSLLLFGILLILFENSLFCSLAKRCTLNSRHYEKKNPLGRYYKNGKEISKETKKKIVDFYNEGCSFPDIIIRTGVLNYSTIKRAISSAKDGHSGGQLAKRKIVGRRNSISSDSVKTATGYYKFRKPSISAKKNAGQLITGWNM